MCNNYRHIAGRGNNGQHRSVCRGALLVKAAFSRSGASIFFNALMAFRKFLAQALERLLKSCYCRASEPTLAMEY